MPLIPEKSRTDSLFYKWFLNNQATMALVITLLAFLTIFVFTKISFFIYASDFFFLRSSCCPWLFRPFCII